MTCYRIVEHENIIVGTSMVDERWFTVELRRFWGWQAVRYQTGGSGRVPMSEVLIFRTYKDAADYIANLSSVQYRRCRVVAEFTNV